MFVKFGLKRYNKLSENLEKISCLKNFIQIFFLLERCFDFFECALQSRKILFHEPQKDCEPQFENHCSMQSPLIQKFMQISLHVIAVWPPLYQKSYKLGIVIIKCLLLRYMVLILDYTDN